MLYISCHLVWRYPCLTSRLEAGVLGIWLHLLQREVGPGAVVASALHILFIRTLANSSPHVSNEYGKCAMVKNA